MFSIQSCFFLPDWLPNQENSLLGISNTPMPGADKYIHTFPKDIKAK